MNLELRNVKWAKAQSRETPCYNADVYIDGVKAGTVYNSGTGGCDMLSPPSLDGLIDAYAKTLPPRPSSLGDEPSPRSWEDVVSDAFERADARREFDRRIKKNVMYLEGGKLKMLGASRGMTPEDVDRLVVRVAEQGKTVLQRLPADEAFALYWDTVKPVGSL